MTIFSSLHGAQSVSLSTFPLYLMVLTPAVMNTNTCPRSYSSNNYGHSEISQETIYFEGNLEETIVRIVLVLFFRLMIFYMTLICSPLPSSYPLISYACK